jgi:hypothetical protein
MPRDRATAVGTDEDVCALRVSHPASVRDLSPRRRLARVVRRLALPSLPAFARDAPSVLARVRA